MARSAPIKEPGFDPDLHDIRHVLDIGLKVQDETRNGRTQSGWYASGLGYCLRRQFLERAGVPSKKDPYPPRQQWVGRTLEASLIARLRHANLLLADNVHLVYEEMDCSGYVDFIWGGTPDADPIDEYEEGEISPQWLNYLAGYRAELREFFEGRLPVPPTGVELKTANQWSAEKMFTEGPQFTHKMQAAFYKVVATEFPEQLPVIPERWQIVVLAKSDAKMIVFDVLDSHVEQAYERLSQLNEAWPTDIPPCTCGKQMKWERDYCPYKSGDSCCLPAAILEAPEDYWTLVDEAERGAASHG